jgi:hypothetical protein
MSAEAHSSASLERDWWLRLALVLQSPSSVFAWLRDNSDEAAQARQEPITAVTFVAGVAIFLSTRTAGHLFDDVELDNLLLVVECVVAGLLVAIQNFWILGGAVHLGGRSADSLVTYRQARHLVGLATTPFVISLVVVWPVRLAMFGSDLFRSGGSDHGAAADVFRGLDALFLAWSVTLLIVGVRMVNGWRLPRTIASLSVAAAVLAAITILFVGLPV